MLRNQSVEVYEKLLQVYPGGVNSPVRGFKGLGMTPLIVDRGWEDQILDKDGHTFIDFNTAWGSLILGHVHPKVVKKTIEQIHKGSSFGITTELELLYGTMFKKLVPSIEKMRVVASGTEATMTAVRLARGYTGRNVIVKFNGHYHGHSDLFLIKAGSGVHEMCQDSSSKGVPLDFVKNTISLPFNDTMSLQRCFDLYGELIAGVILEPIAGNMGVIAADKEFMQVLSTLTKKTGALLIFDEVITGFRLGLEGAQGLYQITPDLSTYSKIVGGGYPVGVIGGKAAIMDQLAPMGSVYQAGTLSGNPVALSGGLAVLEEVSQKGFYDQLNQKSLEFYHPIEKLIQELDLPITFHAAGSMFSFFFGLSSVNSFEDLEHLDKKTFSEFFVFLFENGVYLSPSAFEASFISSVHTREHLAYTQNLICEFLDGAKEKIKARSIKIECAT